ncbi:hypothetical protein NEOLEDRAFT_1039444, partial [Neolentinus lepideus HHB14362 ss-1]
LLGYVDDTFSWEFLGKVLFYPPYGQYYPTKQALLLMLWDEIGLPHEKPKQEYAPNLTIIGFDVDPALMRVTMPYESKFQLVNAIREFCKARGRRRSLREWQRLAGWINWSFNAFPLLRPGLANVYLKMSGKSHPNAPIHLNKAVVDDLAWIADHLESSDGIYMMKALIWD